MINYGPLVYRQYSCLGCMGGEIDTRKGPIFYLFKLISLNFLKLYFTHMIVGDKQEKLLNRDRYIDKKGYEG